MAGKITGFWLSVAVFWPIKLPSMKAIILTMLEVKVMKMANSS